VGVKIRRGLGTTDPKEADVFVSQLKKLLGDESYWSIAEKLRARQRFDEVVVRAFYEPMESPAESDPFAAREEEMQLPGQAEGYSRVMLIGTTGAGKTSLLRQMIGSHPNRDRFPSISPNRTTIADIEVIAASGEFQAVVTFFPRRQVRTYVAESLLEACRAAWQEGTNERVMYELLNHRDQRFKLGYLLGSWSPANEKPDEDDWGEETGKESDEGFDHRAASTGEEQASMQAALEGYLKRIRTLATQADGEVSKALGEPLREADGDDQEAAAGLLAEQVEKMSGYTELLDEIAEEVLRRFERLDSGTLTRRAGWPEKWTFQSADRAAFIRQMRWFSSNHHREYGRLLTPVVQGLRVKGPFLAAFSNEIPKVVLIDGEGLGHTPDSAASVSTQYTSRYRSVDVILVVDNAEQPMQAAPLSVLRSVGTSGHAAKLAIAFTHFDAVKGDNLPNFAAKRGHVLAAVKGALESLREEAIGDGVVGGLERRLDERCFMLGWLDRPTDKIPQGARKQLDKLMRFCEPIVEPEETLEARPLYDLVGLAFAVQSAARGFHSLWDARLGYQRRDGLEKEHWTRVKALTRRVTLRMDNYEYSRLKPVAELIGRLSRKISQFLDAPTRWDPPIATSQDERAAAINRIRTEVHTLLHPFAMERIVEQHLKEWKNTFEQSGRGSSCVRAKGLREIYAGAVPVPGVEVSQVASAFLGEVRKLVVAAIRKGGGDIVLEEKV